MIEKRVAGGIQGFFLERVVEANDRSRGDLPRLTGSQLVARTVAHGDLALVGDHLRPGPFEGEDAPALLSEQDSRLPEGPALWPGQRDIDRTQAPLPDARHVRGLVLRPADNRLPQSGGLDIELVVDFDLYERMPEAESGTRVVA